MTEKERDLGYALLGLLLVPLIVSGIEWWWHAQLTRPQASAAKSEASNHTAVASTASATTGGKTTTSIRQWIPARVTPNRRDSRVTDASVDTPQATSDVAPEGFWQEITVTTESNATASSAATSEATADASVSVEASPGRNQRLGVMAGCFPGYVALDVRLLGLGPVGVDVEANHLQAGVGLSFSQGVGFVTGGYRLGYDLSHGPYAGLGLRF